MRIRIGAALAAMGMLASAPAAAQPETMTQAETVWQLRAALNVAALGCRGPGEATTIAGYNALLATERAKLAEALAAVGERYKARYGAAWQARFDDAMTRAYNHWADPVAHDGFCAEAESVLRDAATVEPSDFAAFCSTALPRLEAPFLRFFADVEAAVAAGATRSSMDAEASAEPDGVAPPVVLAAVVP